MYFLPPLKVARRVLILELYKALEILV